MEVITLIRNAATLYIDGNTAIIAHLDVHTGKSVEKRRFPRVRIAHKGYINLLSPLKSYASKVVFADGSVIFIALCLNNIRCLFF